MIAIVDDVVSAFEALGRPRAPRRWRRMCLRPGRSSGRQHGGVELCLRGDRFGHAGQVSGFEVIAAVQKRLPSSSLGPGTARSKQRHGHWMAGPRPISSRPSTFGRWSKPSRQPWRTYLGGLSMTTMRTLVALGPSRRGHLPEGTADLPRGKGCLTFSRQPIPEGGIRRSAIWKKSFWPSTCPGRFSSPPR